MPKSAAIPFPETNSEMLRYEIAQRAEQHYQRMRLCRTAVVLSALAASSARAALPLLLVPPSDQFLSTESLCVASLFASAFTGIATWLARTNRDQCRKNYGEYLGRTRPGFVPSVELVEA
jgi:hypothetical protein